MLVKFRTPLTPNLLMTLAQLRFIFIPSSSSCAMWLLFVNSRKLKMIIIVPLVSNSSQIPINYYSCNAPHPTYNNTISNSRRRDKFNHFDANFSGVRSKSKFFISYQPLPGFFRRVNRLSILEESMIIKDFGD